MLVIVVVFCSHCLSPLETELVENIEVFSGNLQSCALLAFRLGVVGALTCLYGTLGAMADSLNRVRLGQLCAALVLAILTQAWVVVGWDLATNSLSLFNLDQARALSLAHTPNSLTYNSVASASDQFDWHKEQTRPFMMRFETLYLFCIQLVFFISLSLAV